MRFGTPSLSALEQIQTKPPKPTSEMFHYMLIFGATRSRWFQSVGAPTTEVLEPNLAQRTRRGIAVLRLPERVRTRTPIMYDKSGGIGFVQERAPGIPNFLTKACVFLREKISQQVSVTKCAISFIGLGTAHFPAALICSTRYRHSEYFEAAARMTWEANQNRINAQAYSEEIVNCILREFRRIRNPPKSLLLNGIICIITRNPNTCHRAGAMLVIRIK